eukprot:Ihof_evm1s574 gene=Ihof_evmTU1s574
MSTEKDQKYRNIGRTDTKHSKMEGMCSAAPPTVNMAFPPSSLLAQTSLLSHTLILLLGILIGLFGPALYQSYGTSSPIYRHKNLNNMAQADYYVVEQDGKPVSSYQVDDIKLRYNFDAKAMLSGGRVESMRFGVDAETKEELKWQLKHKRTKFMLEIRKIMMNSLGFKHFDLQAILNNPRLFMLSPAQWKRFILGDLDEEPNGPPFIHGLDIGAGNGFITKAVQPLFSLPMITTDVSNWIAMRQRLNGFRTLVTENLTVDLLTSKGYPATYDLVMALNVLDSCPDPSALLTTMVDLLAPN